MGMHYHTGFLPEDSMEGYIFPRDTVAIGVKDLNDAWFLTTETNGQS